MSAPPNFSLNVHMGQKGLGHSWPQSNTNQMSCVFSEILIRVRIAAVIELYHGIKIQCCLREEKWKKFNTSRGEYPGAACVVIVKL